MVKRGFCLLGVMTLFCTLFSYDGAYANTQGSAKFSVDINQTILELTVPASPAVIDLNPTMTNSSFGSATINFSAATNNQTGYTVTMTPVSTDNNYPNSLIRTELIGEETSYRRIDTLAQTDPASTGYTEDTFTANRWGYRILANSNYYGIDENSPSVSSPAWVVEEPTNGANHSLTVAAKVNAETVSGSYATTLNISAVTNSLIVKDTISFNKNDAGASGSMEDFVVVEGTPAQLPLNAFTAPSGKKFVGWSTTANGTNGKYYDNGATYETAGIGYNQHVTLFAIWADENFPTSSTPSGVTGTTLQRAYEIAYTAAGLGMYIPDDDHPGTFRRATSGADYQNIGGRDVRFSLQDMTSEICNSATVALSEAFVVDTRDWYSYWITKAEDGRCWMTQNLNFYITGATLSHETTDIGWDTASTRTSWTPPSGAITVNELGQGWSFPRTAVSREPNNTVHRASSAPFNHYNVIDETVNHSLHYFGLLSDCIEGGFSEEQCQHSHLGLYYSWAAATAVDIIPNPITGGSTLPDSICPAHWKLPTPAEYHQLIRQQVIVHNRATIKYAPYYFTGPWGGGQRTWTNTAANNNDAYMLSESGTDVTFWYMGGYETTMRCIAR